MSTRSATVLRSREKLLEELSGSNIPFREVTRTKFLLEIREAEVTVSLNEDGIEIATEECTLACSHHACYPLDPKRHDGLIPLQLGVLFPAQQLARDPQFFAVRRTEANA